ncbi:ABC transporter [Arthrobacter sp. MYb211]|uniref:ABC-F family ATP-binding cassette domain-containing protein n=1 Tax=unclassified Arthrobacter TaxID=235627 RepID=UPI000CFC2124|nr:MULTISPECIES: ATP-binding cassette domain-containing protein [unclassified Arthrobacter]PRA11982.1 ABC transporter [Arthrobacter sp. MYb221]PRC08336.1 ABC transporter [Arthrobacter sp. MYb211]
MGHLTVNNVSVSHDGQATILQNVNFKVSEGEVAVLIGPNGSGKTSLLRILSGQDNPSSGSVAVHGGLGVMPQFVRNKPGELTVRELCLTVAPPLLRNLGRQLIEAEQTLARSTDEADQFKFAELLAEYGDGGGYELEVLWDKACTSALGLSFDDVAERASGTLSGGEQKRLLLEILFEGREGVLLLDEPDNYLDVPGKEWLEARLLETDKAVLLVSHDRQLLSNTSSKVVAVDAGTTWTHGGSFTGWDEIRAARISRLEELHRRWDEEHDRLIQLVHTLREQAKISASMAPKYRAMQTRLRKYEEAGRPPELPIQQKIVSRLFGSRTGLRTLTTENLVLEDLTKAFSLELFYGDRVAVIGGNGTGKSHFLRLLAGEHVDISGTWGWGSRVKLGYFAQTHSHPEWEGQTAIAILQECSSPDSGGREFGTAMSMLSRYGIGAVAELPFDKLSGGQQARLQVLLLEAGGSNVLLLDEPTDNLDLVSAEALQKAILAFDGVVVAVTHDRWFARTFDRFVHFASNGMVSEPRDPIWHE